MNKESSDSWDGLQYSCHAASCLASSNGSTVLRTVMRILWSCGVLECLSSLAGGKANIAWISSPSARLLAIVGVCIWLTVLEMLPRTSFSWPASLELSSPTSWMVWQKQYMYLALTFHSFLPDWMKYLQTADAILAVTGGKYTCNRWWTVQQQ